MRKSERTQTCIFDKEIVRFTKFLSVFFDKESIWLSNKLQSHIQAYSQSQGVQHVFSPIHSQEVDTAIFVRICNKEYC